MTDLYLDFMFDFVHISSKYGVTSLCHKIDLINAYNNDPHAQHDINIFYYFDCRQLHL